MGLFKDLMNKIRQAAERPEDAARGGGGAPESQVQAKNRQAGTATATMGPVDVNMTLDKLAASNKEKLDWKHSIVDLMKLVGMDSSIGARKALAADLKYTGDTNDSATMNIWLHKEVMRKLGENGGKLPADLASR